MGRRRSDVVPMRGRTERRRPLGLVAACLAVFVLTVALGLAGPHLQQASGRFTSGEAATVVRVIDGDTFELATGERVRILNIDTAEMPPRADCAREAQLAVEAKNRLVTLLNEGDVELIRRGRNEDQYGRLLRLVRSAERDVGEVLVQEGLAQRWRGHKAEWC